MSVGVEGFEIAVAAATGLDRAGYVWDSVARILRTDVVYRCSCRARQSQLDIGWHTQMLMLDE